MIGSKDMDGSRKEKSEILARESTIIWEDVPVRPPRKTLALPSCICTVARWEAVKNHQRLET